MQTLYTTGYSGNLTQLSLDKDGKLAKDSSTAAGKGPCWLAKHPKLPVIYATDEFSEGSGTILSFKIGRDGLSELDKQRIPGEGSVTLAG